MILFWLFVLLLLLCGIAFYSWFSTRGKVWDVDGHHIFLSGGSEGLGLELAKLLVSKGAHVTIVARNVDKLKAAKESIEQKRLRKTQKVLTYAVDVANSGDLNEAVQKAISEQGPIDTMIANAGTSIPKYFSDLSEQELWTMMDVNFYGAVNLTRSVLPLMKKARAGKIIFVASAMSVTAFCGYSGYCASKW